MKRNTIFTLLLTLVYSGLFAQSPYTDFFNLSDSFFKQYVKNGLVDYSSINSSSESLNELVQVIASTDLSRGSKRI